MRRIPGISNKCKVLIFATPVRGQIVCIAVVNDVLTVLNFFLQGKASMVFVCKHCLCLWIDTIDILWTILIRLNSVYSCFLSLTSKQQQRNEHQIFNSIDSIVLLCTWPKFNTKTYKLSKLIHNIKTSPVYWMKIFFLKNSLLLTEKKLWCCSHCTKT